MFLYILTRLWICHPHILGDTHAKSAAHNLNTSHHDKPDDWCR